VRQPERWPADVPGPGQLGPMRRLLALGPLQVALSLRAPAELTARVARWLAGAVTPEGPRSAGIPPAGGLPASPSRAVELCVDARFRRAFADFAGVRTEPDGAVLRHDLRLRRVAGGWHLECWPELVSLDAGLRWVTATELLARGGLAVHGATAVVGGRAHAFLGASGAGKSTLAREAGFRRVLCDELSLLAPRPGDGRWCAWPSPFWGDGRPGHPGGEPAELAAVWVLSGWERTGATPFDGADALLAVLSRSLDVARDAEGTSRVLDVAHDLVEAVPVGRLGWRRGDALEDLLDFGGWP
jgi:hypothetical protein